MHVKNLFFLQKDQKNEYCSCKFKIEQQYDHITFPREK